MARNHATKSPAQLDREIEEFLARPKKLGDPAYESEWAELLAQKHARARLPTINELAHAFSYIEREYSLKDGRISSEQWAEGLAFGQNYSVDSTDRHQANEAFKQLSEGTWLRIAERANYIAREQQLPQRYVK